MFAFLILQPVLYRYRKLSKAALHPTALILLYILDLTVESGSKAQKPGKQQFASNQEVKE